MAQTDSLQTNYACGAVIGVILAGILADLFLQNKRFLTILVLNLVLLFWDFYLIADYDNHATDSPQERTLFFVTLGAILASNDLIYLILIPMLIAKNHSEKMAQLSRYQRVCYAGTIAGVVLALCEVGRYLLSDNLASFLSFISQSTDQKNQFVDALITIALLLIANLIIWGPTKREFV